MKRLRMFIINGEKEVQIYMLLKKVMGNLPKQTLKALNEDKTMQVFRQQYIGSEKR